MDMLNYAVTAAEKAMQSICLSAMGLPVLIAALVIALLTCFLGLKVFRIWMAFLGFVLGFAVGYGIPANLLAVDVRIAVGIGVAAGVLLAILLFWVYKVSVMLYCLISGTLMAASFIHPKSLLWWGLCIAIGLVIALIALKLAEPIVILLSALGGGFMAASLTGKIFGIEDTTVLLIIAGALSVLGMLVQFIMEGHKRGKRAVKTAGKIRNDKSVELEIEAARHLIDNESDEESE